MQPIATPTRKQEGWTRIKLSTMIQITRSADLTYQEAQIYYRTIYNPRIQYVTHLLPISKASAKKNTNQGVYHILPKMGYSSSTPHGISLGQKSYGGLGMIDIRVEQGARNLITFAEGFTDNSFLANMIRTVTKWWWFQIGKENNPFQIQPENIAYVKSEWFNNMCCFIQEYNIQVKLQVKSYPPLRQKDEFIMELVLMHSKDNWKYQSKSFVPSNLTTQ